jgi:hypothetical protein
MASLGSQNVTGKSLLGAAAARYIAPLPGRESCGHALRAPRFVRCFTGIVNEA